MDVRCERCNTEYEFDDALVSGRGTTVKCTNCGHKFRIRRRDGDFSEDFWNVKTRDGRTLVFTSLRELQRAIQTKQVVRDDELSRGGLPPKSIVQIPELAPFFEASRTGASSSSATSTAPGVGPEANAGTPSGAMRASRPPPPPGAPPSALAAPARGRTSTRPDFPPEPSSDRPAATVSLRTDPKSTLVGPGGFDAAGSAAPPSLPPPLPRPRPPSIPPERAAKISEPPPTDRDPAPNTERLSESGAAARSLTTTQRISAPDTPSEVSRASIRTTARIEPPARSEPARSEPVKVQTSPPAPRVDTSSPLPPPLSPAVIDGDEVESIRSVAPSSFGRRRSVGGYVIALVVVLGVAGVAFVWARDNLSGSPTKPATSATVVDPRVASLLAAGDKALADGNLDAAKESFDKASVLAEGEPYVLLSLARLASARADVLWLRVRLLPEDAAPGTREGDDLRLATASLAELSTVAGSAADAALAAAATAAPEGDATALRAKVDALRIAGDRDAARALVEKLPTSASATTETAYVLAALDLAEAEPLWSTVIERLRTASSAESGPGRARAALVYGLARSGDVAGARAELDRLASMSRQHPLFPLLRVYVERAAAGADAGAGRSDVDDGGTQVDAGARRDPKEPKEPREPKDPKDVRPSTDPRVLVRQGDAARAKGDYDRAVSSYEAALERNGSDTEALSGLAAVAYARRDLGGARAAYKRVLSVNPSYVPALVGVADVDWESGDRASAMKAYKEIVDRFPEGAYPARVRSRVEPAAPPDHGGGG